MSVFRILQVSSVVLTDFFVDYRAWLGTGGGAAEMLLAALSMSPSVLIALSYPAVRQELLSKAELARRFVVDQPAARFELRATERSFEESPRQLRATAGALGSANQANAARCRRWPV